MSQLIMLGTGNAMCTRCYNTCFYLRTPSGGLMVDAGGGNGIFRQLFKARIAFEEVHHIFVTHCHPDHLLGVVWMIRKISPMMNHGRYQGTLTIYCHDEVAHALRTIGALLLPAKIWSAVDQTILFREVTDGEQVTIDDITLTCFDTGAVKTKQFGFHAVLPDGQRLCCLGDEPYDARSERYARDCDWLLHEAFCLERDAALREIDVLKAKIEQLENLYKLKSLGDSIKTDGKKNAQAAPEEEPAEDGQLSLFRLSRRRRSGHDEQK